MDSAKTTVDEGTSWAPEDRGWLWYNDTIETHAFALRTLMELEPADARSEGLVQWLFLNKKLNHWKSTRATSEVIYSVAWFLKQTGALGVRETVTAEACGTKTIFTFEPDKYTGKKNQLVIAGDKLGPECATVKVDQGRQGHGLRQRDLALQHGQAAGEGRRRPVRGRADLLQAREEGRGGRPEAARGGRGARGGRRDRSAPVDPGQAPGRVRPPEGPAAVRVRAGDARGRATSGTWGSGATRRSGTAARTSSWSGCPQGEYTLKHRIRCAMAGTFKAAPATLQSMYAPEFAAYSAGALLTIK